MINTLVATPDPPERPQRSIADEAQDFLSFFVKKELSPVQELIIEVCDEIKELLLEKNRKYGNSAISPARIFSKADPIEQINVRIDDKLSRVLSGQADEDEDIDTDLIGYLVLKKVAIRNAKTL